MDASKTNVLKDGIKHSILGPFKGTIAQDLPIMESNAPPELNRIRWLACCYEQQCPEREIL